MLNLTAAQSSIVLLATCALSALLLVGLVLSAIAGTRSRRLLGGELHDLGAKLDQALTELRSQAQSIERLDSRTQVHEIGANTGKLFDAAVRMAKTGASTDQLTANSGLTRQEARLLARLHGPEKLSA